MCMVSCALKHTQEEKKNVKREKKVRVEKCENKIEAKQNAAS